MACSRSSWASDACEYSGAVELTVKNALPSFNPVAAEAARPGSVDERAARRRHRRDVRYPGQLRGVAVEFGPASPRPCRESPRSHRSAELIAKSARSSSPTWRACAELGSTRSSG